jgi:hypothetical protein
MKAEVFAMVGVGHRQAEAKEEATTRERKFARIQMVCRDSRIAGNH